MARGARRGWQDPADDLELADRALSEQFLADRAIDDVDELPWTEHTPAPAEAAPVGELVDGDAERYRDGGRVYGPPVDPPRQRPTLYATVTASEELDRPEIVPAWMRNPAQRKEVVRAVGRQGAHRVLYHLTRSPKYAAKVLLWAPVGLVRGLWRLLRWTFDAEGASIRQHMATTNQAREYLLLSRQRDRRVGLRLWVTVPALALAAVGVAALVLLAPLWVQLAVAAVLLPLLAWAGRPADRPIVDRTVVGAPFTRLTAELVRTALVSIGIARLRDPAELTFPVPIHRDGPGWLARVNLPAGVDVAQVLERRPQLSSALRLPVDQVWPAPGPDHAGQLDLWVGLLPASRMAPPRWSLASPTARTSVFEPAEFGTDQRLRPVTVTLFENNFLIGGRPGSGKTYAGRALATIAALDPTCELKIIEYKGSADFGDFAPLCSTYVCGLGDADFMAGLATLQWGLAEAERRAELIRRAREKGQAPLGKVTPELARRAGSGLHPVLILIDEAHELFGDSTVGKQAAAVAERLVKRGRAFGIILVLITQIPDKDSLPTGVSRNIGVRMCLAVSDQVANDMILGTGAYKRGITGTIFRPRIDAGWGMVVGLDEPTAVRTHLPDPATTAAIIKRATQLRGGAVVGSDVPVAPARDVLDDVLRVFAVVGRTGLPWRQLPELLTRHVDPDTYARHTPESISALLRGLGVPSVDIKVDGKGIKGCRLDDVRAAQARAELTAATPPPGPRTSTD